MTTVRLIANLFCVEKTEMNRERAVWLRVGMRKSFSKKCLKQIQTRLLVFVHPTKRGVKPEPMLEPHGSHFGAEPTVMRI